MGYDLLHNKQRRPAQAVQIGSNLGHRDGNLLPAVPLSLNGIEAKRKRGWMLWLLASTQPHSTCACIQSSVTVFLSKTLREW